MASLSSKARRRWEYCGLSRSLARSLSSLLACPGLRQTGRVMTQNTRGGTGRTTRGLNRPTMDTVSLLMMRLTPQQVVTRERKVPHSTRLFCFEVKSVSRLPRSLFMEAVRCEPYQDCSYRQLRIIPRDKWCCCYSNIQQSEFYYRFLIKSAPRPNSRA